MKTETKSKIDFRIFRATGVTAWEKPMLAAAEFASTLERNDILSISHSSDGGDGTVVVWYVRSST